MLRNRNKLDQSLAPLVSGSWRRTPDDLKDLLRIGAHQVLRLSRIPSYAAVQTTVDVAKRARGPDGARLINAVLRRLVEQSDAGARPSEGGLAAIYSHPEWLVARWLARFGEERTEALLQRNNEQPPLTLQPVRWPAERLREELARDGVAHCDAVSGPGIIVRGRAVAALPGYREGAFVVQDAGSARLLEHARIPDGALVWDACAAPGGKAASLATRCRVLASESRRSRIARLVDTVSRAAPTVLVAAADARRPPVRGDSMDVVLVDAPCTATGTMARHPDARWRLEPDRIEHMARLQSVILTGAAPVVREGGLLVYITCSLEPEENEERVDRFLKRHSHFSRDGEDLFLMPGDTGTDGGYVARLRRHR